MSKDLTIIRAGFIPLTDAAPLIVARAKGFAAQQGLDLQLSRETSWATIRDARARGKCLLLKASDRNSQAWKADGDPLRTRGAAVVPQLPLAEMLRCTQDEL